MNIYRIPLQLFSGILFASCVSVISNNNSSVQNSIYPQHTLTETLSDSIKSVTSHFPGETGVAVIINNSDTVTVNNECKYAMMSVFKLHQAIALCHDLEQKGVSIDSIINIERKSLDAETWSPMLKDHKEEEFRMSIKDLMRYTLIHSDNNASNLMFDRLTGLSETNRFIATIIPRNSFNISVSESDMKADHARSYDNKTSPSGAAMLINRLFTDSIISAHNQEFLQKTLQQCQTGSDRISAPLIGKNDIKVAHKTGSGYINDKNQLIAHNDVAFIALPNGKHYAISVFVKDFPGNEQQASTVIAEISKIVYTVVTEYYIKQKSDCQ